MTMLYSPELREPAAEDWQVYIESREKDGDYCDTCRWSVDLTTNQVLESLGFTHRPAGTDRHDVMDGERVVFTGSLPEINVWLAELGPPIAHDEDIPF